MAIGVVAMYFPVHLEVPKYGVSAMALLIPFTTIYLVKHAAGGAIVNYGGAYIAGTYIPASVVSAFAAATTSLSAVATSPVFAVGAVAAAAVGGYCYFFGVPAPVAKSLVTAGLAQPAKGGLAVSIGQLAAVLVLLAASGLVSFNVYRRVRHARSARIARIHSAEAEATSKSLFGDDFWREYGAAAWSGVGDSVSQVQESASKIGLVLREAARNVLELSAQAGGRSVTRIEMIVARFRGLFARA